MAAQYEAQMVTVMAHQFNAQRDKILANLDTSRIGKSYSRKDWLSDLLDWVSATQNFSEAIKPIVHATLITAGQAGMQEIGMEPTVFDPFSPAIVDYFQNRSVKIAKDVNDETEKQLRTALGKGVLDGLSTHELRAVVEDVMGTASTMRADRIARTEVARAQGHADIQAWTQSGVVSGKEFYTAEDEHVCSFCDNMDHTIIPLDENFFNRGDSLTVDGKTLNFNYDDVSSANLHVNCRCTLLPVRS